MHKQARKPSLLSKAVLNWRGDDKLRKAFQIKFIILSWWSTVRVNNNGNKLPPFLRYLERNKILIPYELLQEYPVYLLSIIH